MDSETDTMGIATIGSISEIQITDSKTVRELLKEKGLLHRHFVVLVNGKRAALDDPIEEGQRVLVLPIIAGG